jgi:amino acid permease
MYFGYLVDVFWLSRLCILAILFMYFGYKYINKIAKIHQQDSQNTSTRKPKYINKIAKIHKRDSQNTSTR